jgi:hypothetical protein
MLEPKGDQHGASFRSHAALAVVTELEESAADTTIELKVERIGALFDAFDPFPLPSRDLSQAAENFIVSWAREAPGDARLRIRIHAPPGDPDEAMVGDAFANHFNYRARVTTADLRELFRVARLSLAIGLAVLAACVLVARVLSALVHDATLVRVITEGLLILGWVANWRPIELLLYDWWPLVRRGRLYRRLAEAPVELVAQNIAHH